MGALAAGEEDSAGWEPVGTALSEALAGPASGTLTGGGGVGAGSALEADAIAPRPRRRDTRDPPLGPQKARDAADLRGVKAQTRSLFLNSRSAKSRLLIVSTWRRRGELPNKRAGLKAVKGCGWGTWERALQHANRDTPAMPAAVRLHVIKCTRVTFK